MPSQLMTQSEQSSPPSHQSAATARTGPLLSIHMTSNRPRNFVEFIDRLERATLAPSSVEVVIKIDDTDEAMNRLLEMEVHGRPFRIKYISTPLEGGFFGLWRCYDLLLKASDPNAYFVIGLNDEMHFKTQPWDPVLARYVELLPDHIFRLRTSAQRHRNYYDFWEPAFANDTSAFMTRKWLEIGGGWCPCNGPDTFQQCVAFYFGWLDRFNAERIHRDIAISDIELDGHGANFGLSESALRRRIGGSLDSYFKLVSHPMQQEAARRAQKLHAEIWIRKRSDRTFLIRDVVRRRRIEIVSVADGSIAHVLPYGLNSLRIWFTNSFRKLDCGYYLGGGTTNTSLWHENFLNYLAFRHPKFDFWLDVSSRRRRYLRLLVEIVSWPFFLIGAVLPSSATRARVLRVFHDAALPVEGQHSATYLVAHTVIRHLVLPPMKWLGFRTQARTKT